jgi:hypothetical protein
MVIENLREMGKHNAEILAVAPGGQGGGMPAAGATPVSIPAYLLPSPGSASMCRWPSIIPFSMQRDRRGSSTLRDSCLIAPPLPRTYSNDVPFSPSNPSLYRNVNIIKVLSVPNPDCSRSNHLAVIVERDNSTLNTCARTDGTAAGGIQETNDNPGIGRMPVGPDEGIRRSLSCIHIQKGTALWPRR